MKHSVIIDNPDLKLTDRFREKTILITGGDSGIGAACVVAFAKEGANIALCYLDDDHGAEATKKLAESYGGKIILYKADLSTKQGCTDIIKATVDRFGQIDTLINNAGTQETQSSIENISEEQLDRTFRTNIYSMFFVTQLALPYMKEGSSIINTTSITSYRGSAELLDYSSTKGAITALTRSLSQNLVTSSIRVNAVAPGPVWTPLVLTSFDTEKLENFGKDQPMGRAAQPYEIAPAYTFLASDQASYITGQVIHVNGGEIING